MIARGLQGWLAAGHRHRSDIDPGSRKIGCRKRLLRTKTLQRRLTADSRKLDTRASTAAQKLSHSRERIMKKHALSATPPGAMHQGRPYVLSPACSRWLGGCCCWADAKRHRLLLPLLPSPPATAQASRPRRPRSISRYGRGSSRPCAGPGSRARGGPSSSDTSDDRAPAAPPPPPPPKQYTVPSGTPIVVRLEQTVSAKTNNVGDTFSGALAQSVVVHGVTVIRCRCPGHRHCGRRQRPGKV